jgi:transcriptional regulatory protein RtcR
VRINKEAKRRYMAFAQSAEAIWQGNFRDLTASVTRMATLAESGRITENMVDAEVMRLRELWRGVAHTIKANNSAANAQDNLQKYLSAEAIAAIDLFDQYQLAAVIDICQNAKSLSEAGRTLFAASRTARGSTNDADRLRKYLTRFGLSWNELTVNK